MDNFELIKSFDRKQMAMFIEAIKNHGFFEKFMKDCQDNCHDELHRSSSPQFRDCIPCIEAWLKKENF